MGQTIKSLPKEQRLRLRLKVKNKLTIRMVMTATEKLVSLGSESLGAALGSLPTLFENYACGRELLLKSSLLRTDFMLLSRPCIYFHLVLMSQAL